MSVILPLGASRGIHAGATKPQRMPQRPLIVASTLVALTASALTVGAHAQTTAAAASTRTALASVHAQQVRALIAAGMPERAVRAASALTAGSLLLPANDMNHDGIQEVLDVRYQSVGADVGRVVIFCRDGATGAVRWRKVIAAQAGHIYVPGPQLIGPKGLPGVVLVDAGSTEANKTLTLSLRLVAYDASGAKFWSHHESGTLDESTNAEQHVPVVDGLDTFQTKAQDWLVGRYSSPGGDNAPVSAAIVRVRGTDGAVTAVGGTVTSKTGIPDVVDVPDLSGDSLPDVVAVVPGTGDGTGVLARRGADGSDIWTDNSLTLNPTASAISVGDVHASTSGAPAVDDVAVSTGTPTGGGLGLPLPVPDPTAPGDHGQVALLDGASGSPVWSDPKDGDSAYPVLLAGKPLKPAVGVLTTDTTPDSSTTTATTTLVTYDGSGTQIYSKSWHATTKSDANGDASTFDFVVHVGDFDADGSADGLVLIAVTSGDNNGAFTTLFRGADGSPVKSGHTQPLGGSTTGHGDGLVGFTAHHGLTITVHKGSDFAVLFSRKVAHSRGTHDGGAFGEPMHDASACADLLVAGQGAKHSIAAVLTAHGALEWVVRFTPGGKAPGTVFRPATAPHIPTCGPVSTT
jgi:hypothetical protein